MKSHSPTQEDKEIKWGYAFAGAIALGFATVIQFAFGSLDDDSLARLPGFIKLAYGIGGKLGITVPLALLGLGLIIRDLASHRPAAASASNATPRSGKSWCAQKAEQDDEDLEVGEPIPGQSMVELPAKPVIAARKPLGAAKTSKPNPEPEENGGVVLSSAKYLNRRRD
jgi:hypothetical protein